MRKRLSNRASRKYFTKGALKVKAINSGMPMRGGIRL